MIQKTQVDSIIASRGKTSSCKRRPTTQVLLGLSNTFLNQENPVRNTCVNNNLPSQLADNVKGNVAAARTKVEQIARGIDIGEKGTLGDLIFGPDQVTPRNPFELFSTVCFQMCPQIACLRACKVTYPVEPFMPHYKCHLPHL